ncbi:hypothetical protein OSB04_008636 [Centaurea solstitialis]|uniref:Uncharacterized protein n=1 Tax=Centaurea solstitialis TaxID=347529 RepID=A0AA38TZY4_9ASTR|nr:hypothetical protein OSB04_008636 [Centaurea solstitialis]
MGFRRLLVEVSRQHSQLRPVKNLLPCSYHTSLKFGGNAGSYYPINHFILELLVKVLPTCFQQSRTLSTSNMLNDVVEGIILFRGDYVRSGSHRYTILTALLSSEFVCSFYKGYRCLEMFIRFNAEAAKELHDKLVKSVVEQRTAPPNNLLWTLIEKCANREDIKLLFNVLENLRKFRLSNLRIFENFNDNLCREISKACVRVEAIDFGKKTLWKHNVYGLTPSVASAHSLLLYAKEHNNANLLVDVMKLLKANDVPLQPGTADIVFSICYNTDRWDLMSKYAKRFVKAGAKLRRTSFDTWMTFAAKLGADRDIDNLWKIEKLRSGLMKTHTIGSAFSCAKGFLLEHKPEEAAAMIQVVTQRPEIMAELEKLVREWPLEVIKRQKDEDKMAMAAGLQQDIPAMIHSLSGLGVKTSVKMDDLTKTPF